MLNFRVISQNYTTILRTWSLYSGNISSYWSVVLHWLRRRRLTGYISNVTNLWQIGCWELSDIVIMTIAINLQKTFSYCTLHTRWCVRLCMWEGSGSWQWVWRIFISIYHNNIQHNNSYIYNQYYYILTQTGKVRTRDSWRNSWRLCLNCDNSMVSTRHG